MDTFHLFPQLDEYLRRLVWKFYFDAPRIHVLHDPYPTIGPNERVDYDVILTNCTILDASTNIPVSSYIRYDIDRESRHVALGLKPKRERIHPLPEKKSLSTTHFNIRTPHTSHTRSIPVGRNDPIDIDWTNDLFYFYSPSSGVHIKGARRRYALSAKIQNIALAYPFQTRLISKDRTEPTEPKPQYFEFDHRNVNDMFKTLPPVREILVAALPPPPISDDAGQEAAPATSSNDHGLERDEFGFVPFVDYLRTPQREQARRIRAAVMDTARIHIAIQTHLELTKRLDAVSVKKCVDIDGWEPLDGTYQRQKRGVPQAVVLHLN